MRCVGELVTTVPAPFEGREERLVVEEEEDEDEEVPEPDDRSEISERVLPKQADEFVCRSCFLVKNSSQLADPKRLLCRDCV